MHTAMLAAATINSQSISNHKCSKSSMKLIIERIFSTTTLFVAYIQLPFK